MKEEYEILSQNEDFPLFMQPWFLESVSRDEGMGWDAIVVKSPKDDILGAMGFHWTKKYGLHMVLMPALIPSVGVWFNHKEGENVYTRRNRETQVLEYIAKWFSASRYCYVDMVFGSEVSNLLPFAWHGYELNVRYTFVVPDITTPDELLNSYHQMKRRQVKKASRDHRCVVDVLTPEQYYDEYSKLLAERKQESVMYSKQYFCSLASSAIERGHGAILSIVDKGGRVCTSLFVLWDSSKAYASSYWTRTSELNSGTSSMVFHEAVKYLNGKTLSFDFEGSMDSGISTSYAMFATRQRQMVRVRRGKGLKGSLIEKIIQIRQK